VKIAAYETIKLRVPLNKPMRTRYFKLEQAYCILLILKTDTGLEGQGLVRAASLQDMRIIERFIHELFAPLWAEKDVSSPGEFWRMLWLGKRNHLQSSFGLYALAAIDIAIWDITAKIASKPLHQFLNVSIDFVVPYGNGGWLSDTKQETISDVEWYLNRGCNLFKMRVGSDNDLDRIKGLRDAFGEGLIFSADANQFYDFDSALSAAIAW
jgi:L-alanine-DL-glutamate epimerase-like enolase superfamily enzyme